MSGLTLEQLEIFKTIRDVTSSIDDLYFALCYDTTNSPSFKMNIDYLRLCLETENSLYNKLNVNDDNFMELIYLISDDTVTDVNALCKDMLRRYMGFSNSYDRILRNDFLDRIKLRILSKLLISYTDNFMDYIEKANKMDEFYDHLSRQKFSDITRRDFYNIFISFLKEDINREINFNLAFIDPYFEKEIIERNFNCDKNLLLLSSFSIEMYEVSTGVNNPIEFDQQLNRNTLKKIEMFLRCFFDLDDKIFIDNNLEVLDIYNAFFQTCFLLLTRKCRFDLLKEMPEKINKYYNKNKIKYDFLMNLLYKASYNDLNVPLVRKKR